MAIIMAPNLKYNGVTASVPFRNGVGNTDDPQLISWFVEHGYKVISGKEVPVATEEQPSAELTEEEMVEKLKAAGYKVTVPKGAKNIKPDEKSEEEVEGGDPDGEPENDGSGKTAE